MEAKDIVALIVFVPIAFGVLSVFIFLGVVMLRAAWEVVREGL